VPQKQLLKSNCWVDMIQKKYSKYNHLIQSINPEVKSLLRFRWCDTSKMVLSKIIGKSHLISAIAMELFPWKVSGFNYFPVTNHDGWTSWLSVLCWRAKLHPSQLAIDYLKRFKETNISETALSIEEVEMIQKSLSHKPST
jgi:hypothetical protein